MTRFINKIEKKTFLWALTILECISSINYSGEHKFIFKMGYSIFSFQEVNPTDASAAISVYASIYKSRVEKVVQKEVVFQSYIYNSLREMKDAFEKNNVDLISLSVNEYYELNKSYKITPYLAVSSSDSPFEQYCILKRNDRNISKIDDMKGKTVSIPEYKIHPMLEDWLINMLAKNKLGPISKAFGQIKFTDKESNAIYNVFFKNSDLAVVRKSVFDAVCEFNPQIKNSVSVLASSPPMIIAFTAGNDNADQKIVSIIIQYTGDLQTTQSGKNILNIFKANKFIKIKKEDLKTALDILTENEYSKQQLTLKTKKQVK